MDSGDWSEINSEMEIPSDTEFVVVSLSAKKSGTDALLANTSSYYSDDLELIEITSPAEFETINI